MNTNTLPKFITARYGLQDKLHELNQNLPMRDRVDGLRVVYNNGEGIVMNSKSDTELGRYIHATTQGKADKFKLVLNK